MTDPNTASSPHSEFSRPLALDQVIDGQALHMSVEANADERSALAARLKLPAVNALTAELAISKWRGSGIAMSGQLSANVTQTCVITLEPFEEGVSGTIEAHFLPPRLIEPQEEEDVLLEAEDEVIEPLPESSIDVGELVTQHLSLALDPHPKKPGAEFTNGASDEPGVSPNPFSVLKGLVDPDS